MKIKYVTARDLLLETKILPAELQITTVSLNRFFNILQQTRNRSKTFQIFWKTCQLLQTNEPQNPFLEQKCKSKWRNGSIVRKFIGKRNTLPITIIKETSKTKFKQNLQRKCLNDKKEFQQTEGLQVSNLFF